MSDKQPEEVDPWAELKAKRGKPPAGMRYLDKLDIVQEGDEYWIIRDEWHRYGPEHFGKPVPLETLCYTPRGLID